MHTHCEESFLRGLKSGFEERERKSSEQEQYLTFFPVTGVDSNEKTSFSAYRDCSWIETPTTTTTTTPEAKTSTDVQEAKKTVRDLKVRRVAMLTTSLSGNGLQADQAVARQSILPTDLHAGKKRRRKKRTFSIDQLIFLVLKRTFV